VTNEINGGRFRLSALQRRRAAGRRSTTKEKRPGSRHSDCSVPQPGSPKRPPAAEASRPRPGHRECTVGATFSRSSLRRRRQRRYDRSPATSVIRALGVESRCHVECLRRDLARRTASGEAITRASMAFPHPAKGDRRDAGHSYESTRKICWLAITQSVGDFGDLQILLLQHFLGLFVSDGRAQLPKCCLFPSQSTIKRPCG